MTYTALYILFLFSFFFNDTATTEIYTLSLHDALPISIGCSPSTPVTRTATRSSIRWRGRTTSSAAPKRSEEHTSELQSHSDLVCRLLLEKKKKKKKNITIWRQHEEQCSSKTLTKHYEH